MSLKRLLFIIMIICATSASFAADKEKIKNNKIKYIVQVGKFNSSYNANQIIKNIELPNDSFVLRKKKEGANYIVFFDDFKNKNSADLFAEQFISLNNELTCYVKKIK